MRKPFLLILLFCLFNLVTVEAQNKMYWKSASEIIFSWGNLDATTIQNGVASEIDVNPIVRFTLFFHLQEQFHYDFSKNVGLITGMGIRNVGFINELNDSIKVKQRSYTLGIPVALKFGNLPAGLYAAIGGEAELFFHYKQKVFYDDEKFKSTAWFSDKTNLINPSVFLDINSKRGTYLRFKYYLLDFLVSDKQKIKNINGADYPYYAQKSQLFYIAIGTTLKHIPNKKSKTPSNGDASPIKL